MSDVITQVMTSVTGAQLDVVQWRPNGIPSAIVQLVHGMAEHIERYDATAKRLNEAGLLVVGHTHLGHGRQAETHGWFAKEDGWDALIEDVHTLRVQTQSQYPGIPYFLLGHSMGSFVVRTYCLKHEQGLTGVILSGTGHFEPAVVMAGLAIANVQCLFGDEKEPSKLLQKISSAGYNRDFEPRTAFDWLTRDSEIVDAYIADEHCGFPFTASGYRDMFRGISRMHPKHLHAMEKLIPILLIAGDADPVGGRGEGVRVTAEELLDAGVLDVTVKLYEGGRHEMFNELEREMVWDDLIIWIKEHLQ